MNENIEKLLGHVDDARDFMLLSASPPGSAEVIDRVRNQIFKNLWQSAADVRSELKGQK